MAKALMHREYGCWLVACVTLRAGEGVDILVVVLALITRHLHFSPDRFDEIRILRRDFSPAAFFALNFLHARLLSLRKPHHML